MERRSALKSMAFAAGGLISLPAWATSWTTESIRQTRNFLSLSQSDLLAEITETIIPATNTPGAKALNVHQLITKIVTDCLDKPAQEAFKNGLNSMDDQAKKAFGKPFAEGDTAQRTALLTEMSKSAEPGQKEFYSMVKNMTIRGYMNSEYVMTNLTHYEMAPGHYYGCVPVVAKAVSQTPAK